MGTSSLKSYVLLAMLEAGAGGGVRKCVEWRGLLLEEDEGKLAEIVASPKTEE